METLQPKIIWHYFNEICQIPHASGKEKRLIEYLVDFGRKHQLETQTDAAGNVLIRKKATPGMEGKPSVALQSHIDMVAEKNEDTLHDFDNDPITPYIEGEWVKARGTTLGADNGIGVAAQLALLASDDIPHGPLECLFTVEEETGLTGAKKLQPDFIHSKKLINLDSNEDGVFCIGCAGGINTVADFHYEEQETPDDLYFFNVKVRGCQGGHSGEDINKNRGNAIKILSRYLWEVNKKYPLYLQKIEGGNLLNAIPREASAVAAVPFSQKEEVRIAMNIFTHDIENEYPAEKEFYMHLESGQPAGWVIDKVQSNKLLNALHACPHGVIRTNTELDGLPEVSTNLASVKMSGSGVINVCTSQRSPLESARNDLSRQIEALFTLAGARVRHSDGYPGWQPNLSSEVTQAAVDSYCRLFGVKPVVRTIHAGLECGLFLEKYPGLDMISIGPTIVDNHSPAEKVHIRSVEKFWEHLKEMLNTL